MEQFFKKFIDMERKRCYYHEHRNENGTITKKGRYENMTLRKILELELVDDNTKVWVRGSDLHLLTSGNWYQDNILEYMNSELECFTWQDDNNFYIDLK